MGSLHERSGRTIDSIQRQLKNKRKKLDRLIGKQAGADKQQLRLVQK
jgi:hypothetical protein